jgi:2-oxoglutarate ferredoxin oxidoreductase subunit gamma
MSSGKKDEKNDISVRFCGLGGMGIILTSIILGKAAIYDNKNALQGQSYGAEQRGSKVRADVIISEKEMIISPEISKADILVALSQEAFDYFSPKTKKESIFFVNSDLVKINESSTKIYKIPANKIATELNNKRVINMIMLGFLIKTTAIVSKESILKSISDSVPKQYIDQNFQAFSKGYEYVNS